MSLGKKKSGFQITSVTSDYEKGALLRGGDGEDGEGRLVENGHSAHRPLPKNGPLTHLASFGASGSGGGGSGSRFRVVKLDHGLGEPYRRGRWTCRDFYDPELEQQHYPHPHPSASASAPPVPSHLARRHHLTEATRQPQSLDSRLEVAGLLSPPCSSSSSSSSAFGSPGQRRAGLGAFQSLLVLPGPGSSAYQARSLGGGLPVHRPGGLAPFRGTLRMAETPPAPEDGVPKTGENPQPSAVPAVRVEDQLLPQSVAQLIPKETEERHKILPRETRSRPSSPAAPLLFREAASPHRRTSDPFGVAPRFNLARSVFGMGGSHDSDEDSGTNSSLIAIDNKIEQAMDLVKSHLMFAVREEVEVLREQIKELSERNAALEQENSLLRSLAGAEPGGHFQAPRQESKPPSGGSA